MFAKLFFYVYFINVITFNLFLIGAATNTSDPGDVDPKFLKLHVALNSTHNIIPAKEGIPVNEGGDILKISEQDDIKPSTGDAKPSKVDPVEYVLNKKGYEQKSSVQARKGVEMPLNGSTDLSIDVKENGEPPQVLIDTKLTQNANKSNANVTSIVPKDEHASPSTATMKFHKPLVTSFVNDDSDLLPPLKNDTLTKIGIKDEIVKVPSTSQLNSDIIEQQAAPVKEISAEPEVKLSDSSTVESVSTFKKYIGPLSRTHPNYIIPIVITIFAVPIFGIFGLTAIRRGREAWKNRHYRRMDFLIDGMYND